jgi:GntR family transcriptional regulator of arabinose operon
VPIVLENAGDNLYRQVMGDTTPKYRAIMQMLSSAIDSGTYGVGSRLPSEHQMVRNYGASRVTVIRALQELRSQGYIERRAGSGTFVSASRAKRLVFGLLIPDLGETEVFEPICRAMASAQQGDSHSLVWGKTLSSAATTEAEARDVCNRLTSSGVSGVFFAPIEGNPEKDSINAAIAGALSQAGIPVVLLDRDIFGCPRRSRFDVVGIDNRRAGFVAARHLIETGCRRVAFLGRPYMAPSCVARSRGYRDAVAESGEGLAPPLVDHFDPTDGVRLAAVMESYRPDGIVCSNDRFAAVLMRTLAGLGISVPDRVKLASFDDVQYASLVTVPLTTVRQPCDQLGAAAMRAMYERLKDKDMPARDILLDFRLVVRESSGAKVPEFARAGLGAQ